MTPHDEHDLDILSNEEPQPARKRIAWPLTVLGALALAGSTAVALGAQSNHPSTTIPAAQVSRTSISQDPITVHCPLYHDGHPTQRSCIALNC